MLCEILANALQGADIECLGLNVTGHGVVVLICHGSDGGGIIAMEVQTCIEARFGVF